MQLENKNEFGTRQVVKKVQATRTLFALVVKHPHVHIHSILLVLAP